ncbi:MAG TPA: hypothetical protein VHT70_04300 [Candidatus Saccharimonadales bacterium]|jgi:hypothetical protein|nr:hypothetical protein [Candidatus Saccharimonadales bacterium]
MSIESPQPSEQPTGFAFNTFSEASLRPQVPATDAEADATCEEYLGIVEDGIRQQARYDLERFRTMAAGDSPQTETRPEDVEPFLQQPE